MDEGLLSRKWVRLTLIGLVGSYLFLVCAAYMARAPMSATVSYAVLGPEVVEPGGSFPVRVVAYVHNKSRHLKSTIRRAVIDDGVSQREVAIDSAQAGIPAMVHVGPAPKSEGPFKLILTLEADGDTRVVDVPLVVYHEAADPPPHPLGLANEIPRDDQLLLELLSEGPGLAMGMDNRVWIRVTDRKGAPVSGASVVWSARGTETTRGVVETDAAGLADIGVVPRNLSARFHLEAARDNATGSLEQTLRPLGRGVLLVPHRMVKTPGEPEIRMSVVRAAPDEPTYCDLYKGDAWLRTWHLPAGARASAVTTLPVPLDEPGTYRFQCYTHFAQPGEGADATWLFYRQEPRLEAMSLLLRGDPRSASGPTPGSRTATYRKHVPIVDDAGQRALLASYRTRHVAVSPPALVANTRGPDMERAKLSNDRVRVRFFLLIGLSFALVILWAIYTALNMAVQTRARLAEAIAELGEDAVKVAPPTRLMLFRKWSQAAFVILVIVLNIVGMLELFKYM